jgi:hypothetical protein
MKDENLNKENNQSIHEEEFDYDIWGQRSDDPNYMSQPQWAFEEEYATKHFCAVIPFEKQDEKKK